MKITDLVKENKKRDLKKTGGLRTENTVCGGVP